MREMTRERFTQLVEEALRDIPRKFRDAMENVAVVVEDQQASWAGKPIYEIEA